MRMIRIAIGGFLVCTILSQPTIFGGEIPPQGKMKFLRDTDKGFACLEYSWIPEGKRYVIRLSPGQMEGEGTGPTSKDASDIQVYRLSIDPESGLRDWNFPLEGPYPSRLVAGEINVSGKEAIGTAQYKNGTNMMKKHQLTQPAPVCPEVPSSPPPPHP
jgi:hypothetical protein